MKPLVLFPHDALYIIPLATLVLGGVLLVLAEAFIKGTSRAFLMKLTVAVSAVAALASIFLIDKLQGQTLMLFSGMLVVDPTALVFVVLFSGATAFTAMITAPHQEEHGWESGEYYGLLLLSAAGMAMLAMAGNLVTVFIGIETMSISVYVLVASRRRSRRSAEAAMKYFLMGAFATGFLLYGIALIYGATGTTGIYTAHSPIGGPALQTGIVDLLDTSGRSPLFIAGVFFLIVAFGFKIAAIPFHMWAPDAYEGAPTPVTGFMAAAVKAAAFAAILRVFGDMLGGDILPHGSMGWGGILAFIAAITMTVGNIAALRQQNVKRMLAYSSISHAGVVLVGVVALGLGAADARPAVVYYLIAYTVTTVGAFAVVSWIGSRERERVLVEDWAGLGAVRPGVALAMTIFLLSLGGIPPTNGFVAKFVVFKAAMEASDQHLLWLVVVGVLNSVLSIFYYLRIVMMMYFRDPLGELSARRSAGVAFVLVVCALLVLWMGILPARWLGYAGG